MLGPVVTLLAFLTLADRKGAVDGEAPKPARPPLHQLVPWFIIGFLLLAAVRALGLIPPPAASLAGTTASVLTIVSMAALGLGVDVRSLANAGPRVSAVVVLSLAILGALALVLVRGLGLA
jgi:uncharacterized membrane protein YadS